MKSVLGIGVIGMGWMGQVHSRAYAAVGDRFYDQEIAARLVICADDTEERAEEARARFGFEQCATNWRAVIDHDEVDVVIIAAPNFLHHTMCLAAAEAGKHVFCEKPVGRSPEETEEIVRAVQRAGVMSFTGFNYRWAPMVQHAHNLIARGDLGELTHYRGRFFSMYGSNPMGTLSWRFEADKGGSGVLGDLMPHVIDMAHFQVGPIRRVFSHHHTFITERPLPVPGRGTHFSLGQPGDATGPVTNEDYVSALVEFENGVQGTLQACRAIFGPKCEMAFEVNGTEGAANWNFERMNELNVYTPVHEPLDHGYTNNGYATLFGGPQYPYHGRFNPGDGIGMGYEDLKVIEAYNFLASIVEGAQRSPSFDDLLAAARVQRAMQASWQSGLWEAVTPVQSAVAHTRDLMLA